MFLGSSQNRIYFRYQRVQLWINVAVRVVVGLIVDSNQRMHAAKRATGVIG